MIITEDFCISYGNTILTYPDMAIQEHEFIGLTGNSGCGKTSFLNAVFGEGVSGDVVYKRCRINGTDLKAMNRQKYKYISYCPQFSQNALNPKLTVAAHIALVKESHQLENMDVLPIMADLNLDESLANAYPYMLSGGQKQRIVLLLCMMKKPRILVLDEPSSAIDLITLRQIAGFLGTIKGTVTIIMVAHQKALVDKLADRVITFGR